MNKRDALTEIVKVAAILARGETILSGYSDDYKVKSVSTKKLARLMADSYGRHICLAERLAKAVRVLEQ